MWTLVAEAKPDRPVMKILKAAQMNEVDRLTTEIYRIPSILLMENAGRSVADALAREVAGLSRKRIVVFCGKGNNGGDGLVVARYLSLRGCRPELVMFCDPGEMRGDAATNWSIAQALGIPTTVLATAAEARRYLRRLEPPDVLVDALFGTGLTKPVGPDFGAIVDYINRLPKGAFVVAVDIPTGLFADSHLIPGKAVRAHLTVTFTALKPALVLPPASVRAGKVVLAPIGSPDVLLDRPDHRLSLVDPAQVRRALPTRPRDGHKGTFGHVFVLAGSRGKSGAALMTGMAALRSGAGLATVLLPEGLQSDVIGRFPELMTEPLPETASGAADSSGLDRVLALLSDADVLVAGPGLTTHPSTVDLVRAIVRGSKVPVVLDADGINAFAGRREALRNEDGQPVIISPHPGEMARLLGTSISLVQKDRLETARRSAAEMCCIVVLKGFQTVVATPEGRIFVNPTGNPGMATGGSGDILAGMLGRFVGGWKCRHQGADRAALADHVAAAVYLHGRAGDFAAEDKGEESLVATDLLPFLTPAFKEAVRG